MPTFDFHCTACDKIFEKTLVFGTKEKPVCPSCGSTKTEKLISMPTVVFKGSGFYKTDSKSGGKPPVKSDKKEESPVPVEKKPEPAKKLSPSADASKEG
jgi:putative FmdB family regulatory protein